MYAWPVDTDTRVLKVWGRGQRQAVEVSGDAGGRKGDICNAFNNEEIFKIFVYTKRELQIYPFESKKISKIWVQVGRRRKENRGSVVQIETFPVMSPSLVPTFNRDALHESQQVAHI